MTDEYSYGEDAATFGDRIVAAREGAGLTQSELAERLGVRLDTLRGWEEDRNEPRADRARILAGLTGVSLTWLLTGEGDAPTDATPDTDAIVAELRRAREDMAAAGARLDRLEARLREALS